MAELRLFLDSQRQFWFQIAAYLPKAIAAALFLLVGWLIAKLLRRAGYERSGERCPAIRRLIAHL
jgi:hypothetical protein